MMTVLSCYEKTISCVGIFGVKLSDLFPPNRYKCIHGELAQMVERPLRMRDVPGSIPGFSKFRVFNQTSTYPPVQARDAVLIKYLYRQQSKKNRLIDLFLAIK